MPLGLYKAAGQRKFTAKDIVFMKSLAGNGDIALEKAHLIERIDKNSSPFLEIASAINSSVNLKEVLRNV